MVARSEPSAVLFPTLEVPITALGTAGSTVAAAVNKTFDLVHVDNALNSNPTYLKLYDDAAAPDHDVDDPNEKIKIPGGGVGTFLMATLGAIDMPWTSGISAAASAASGQTDTEPANVFNCRIGYHDVTP